MYLNITVLQSSAAMCEANTLPTIYIMQLSLTALLFTFNVMSVYHVGHFGSCQTTFFELTSLFVQCMDHQGKVSITFAGFW